MQQLLRSKCVQSIVKLEKISRNICFIFYVYKRPLLCFNMKVAMFLPQGKAINEDVAKKLSNK